MRVLTPKYALASLVFIWLIWLAMSGKLTEFIALASKPAERKSVMK